MKDATQFHIRPARPEEAGLFYTPRPEEDKRLGAVGHVRMDFGHSEGWTLPAYPEAVRVVYPRTLLTAENAAKLPCEQVLGAYTVTFER